MYSALLSNIGPKWVEKGKDEIQPYHSMRETLHATRTEMD